ncbi:MAG: alginate lyase family protein [Gemmatimonadaceae bacterium]
MARGTQAFAALLERSHIVPAPRLRDPSGTGNDAERLARFRGAPPPRAYPALGDVASTAAALRSRHPDAAAMVVARADRIIAGRFDVLGLRDVEYGESPDWQRDPVSGKRAPDVHWSRVPYLDAAVVGDHKVTWELNRAHHLVTLGQAYALTGDARYVARLSSLLGAWIDGNPPKRGINWASSLEISLRSIAWLWALQLIRDAPGLDGALLRRALGVLHVSGKHIETYLSTYFAPNTHLTGEALGLLSLGSFLTDSADAARWRDAGWRILVEQAERQIRADGVYFEQATWYQRYTADFFLHAILLARGAGLAVPAPMARRVEAAVDHLMYLTQPDGRTPLIGDDDGGRTLPLDARAPADFRGTLALGAALFARGDWAAVADGATESVNWTLGAGGLVAFDALVPAEPPATSIGFPDGGYFVMRDRWARDAQYLVADCGPHGALIDAHSHADALAFVLSAFGRPLLIDPGTYSYVGADRDLFRGARAHNALLLDAAGSSDPADAFRWRSTARCALRAWVTREHFDYFAGSHDGFARQTADATHERSILYLKGRYWIVRDRVAARGAHIVEARFHAPAGGRIDRRDDARTALVVAPRRAGEEPIGLLIAVLGGDGAFTTEDGWVSESYGARSSAPVCSYVAQASDSLDVVTALVPVLGDAPEMRAATPLQAAGGEAYAIGGAGFDDLLLVRRKRLRGDVAAREVTSDAELAWFGATADDGTIDEFVMLDGSRLRIRGEDIVARDVCAAWTAGRLERGRWHIEMGGETAPSAEG